MKIWQGNWGAMNQLLLRREVLNENDLFDIEWNDGVPYRTYAHGAGGDLTEVTDCVLIAGEVDAL